MSKVIWVTVLVDQQGVEHMRDALPLTVQYVEGRDWAIENRIAELRAEKEKLK